MKPVQKVNFENPVVTVKIIKQNYFLVADSHTTLSYLDIETLEEKAQFKSNAVHQRYINRVVDFDSHACYMSLITTDAQESRLYDLKKKKVLGSVKRHQGEVSCVAIDPKNRYMFSGGDDGVTFGVDLKSGQLAFTLPRHIDTINDIAFSKNGNWVATASYDKNIALFSFITMKPFERLKAHSAPVIKLHFLEQNRLLSIDKDGGMLFWRVTNAELIHRVNNLHDEPTQITVDIRERFLFVGTKLGYIVVYDLSTYELVARKYIKLKSMISALAFNSNTNQLIVGTQGGDLLVYNIFEYENGIYEAITYKKYELIDGYVEKNPLLRYSEIYARFESLWEQTIQKGKLLIESGERKKAEELFKYFIAIPSKRQLIEKLFQKYKDYDKFVVLVKQNKLPLAYSMANASPHYKETKAYKEMEKGWKKRVILAQKYLLTSNNESKVRELFAPYRAISEKTVVIQDLLQNSKVYNLFKRLAANKEFKSLFELIKRHPFLKESAEYSALMQYSDSLYIEAQKQLDKGNIHAAVKNYRILLDFEDFNQEAREVLEDLKNRQKFFSALEAKDYATAFDILDSSDVLQMTPEGKKLDRIWERDYEKASVFAAKADTEGVKKSLAKYLKMSSKQTAIATLISWCYITELNRALQAKLDQKIVEEGIKNYILYFGPTDQISAYFALFLKRYPETKLKLDALVQGSMEKWRSSMIIKSILDLPATCSI